MGVGANVTRIASIFNRSGISAVPFENPESSGDNVILADGLHEFPFGAPVSIPWSWERALTMAGVGALWRDAQDVRFSPGRRPTRADDGDVIFTHTYTLEEEYVFLELGPTTCRVLRSVRQIDAIIDNLGLGFLRQLSGELVTQIVALPELALALAKTIDDAIKGGADPVALKTFAAVDPAAMGAAMEGLSAGEMQTLAAAADGPTSAEQLKIVDKVLEALQIGVGTIGGVIAAILGLAAVWLGAIAGGAAIPTAGISVATAGLAAFVCGLIGGIIGLVTLGAEGALALTRYILSFFMGDDAPAGAQPDAPITIIPIQRSVSALYAAQRGGLEAFFVGESGILGFRFNIDGLPPDMSSFSAAGPIRGAVSAVFAPQRAHAEVFAVGESGGLYYFFQHEGWRHDSASFTPAGRIKGPISAVFGVDANHSEVFVVAEDGGLHRFHIAGGWRYEPVSLGPIGVIRAVSAAFSSARNHSEVYAIGEDNLVRFGYFEGGAWRSSVLTQVGPVAGAISAVYSPARGHTEAFVVGDDRRLRFIYAAGGAWQHDRDAFAGFGEVTGPIAAVYAPQRQESEVFFRGADGLLHYVYRGPGGAWAHDGASFRGAGRVVGGISAIFHPGRAHAEVIFAGEGDRLHHFFVADGRWQHASY